jgi:hypothetical protein
MNTGTEIYLGEKGSGQCFARRFYIKREGGKRGEKEGKGGGKFNEVTTVLTFIEG